MFAKVLVANRGEIAIRAFRAAYELGRADRRGVPVRGPQLRAPAQGRRGLRDRRARAPGPRLPRPGGDRRGGGARAAPTRSTPATASCRRTRTSPRRAPPPGSRSSAPPPRCCTLTGNKARAIAAAKAAGVPTLQSIAPGTDLGRAGRRPRRRSPFPLFVKAVAGGGGRGMRRVDDPAQLREAVETCMREAEGAFGDPTVFIEQAVVDPRHIEVQILADAAAAT